MDPNTEGEKTPPLWLLSAILLAVSLGVHCWLIANTQVTSRDSLSFARMALQFDNPTAGQPAGESPRTRLDVLREVEHPPGYPASVCLMSIPVRAVYQASPAEQFLRSAQVVSLVASLLLALVLFHLGREVFSTTVGFIAALLFQFLPVAARTTSDGISEGLFLLALTGAMLFGVKAIRDQHRRDYFVCGLLTALAYLVRPEGLLLGFVVALALVGAGLSLKLSPWQVGVRTAALVLGVAILSLPYMVAVGDITNKPTGRKLIQWILGSSSETAQLCRGPLFAGWYVSGEDPSRPIWILLTYFKETGKAFNYIPAFFAIIGYVAVIRTQWRTNLATRVPVLFIAAHSTLLLLMATTSGYLSERHTLPVVCVGSIFAAQGIVLAVGALAERRHWRPRVALAATVGVLTLACLPQLARARHSDRLGHVIAGRWLAGHTRPTDAIVDPFDWAQFFSGRTLYRLDPDPHPATAFYAVIEEGKTSPSRSKLPRHWYAEELAKIGRPVFRCPMREGDRTTQVVIYRFAHGEQ